MWNISGMRTHAPLFFSGPSSDTIIHCKRASNNKKTVENWPRYSKASPQNQIMQNNSRMWTYEPLISLSPSNDTVIHQVPASSHHTHSLQLHSTLQTFRGLQQHSDILPCMCSPSPNILSCVHASHIKALLNIWCYPHMLYKTFTNLHTHIPLHPGSCKHIVSHLQIWSTLTLNIQYYSHMPHSLLTGSPGTFGPSSFCFLSTPDIVGTHLQIFLLCKDTQACTLAFIHSHQSSLFVCTFWSLELPLDQLSSTAISGLHALNQLVPACPLLIPFYFLFISFSFWISLIFYFFYSHFTFLIFVFLLLSFMFLFPNIFKYLYTHVLVVSQ